MQEAGCEHCFDFSGADQFFGIDTGEQEQFNVDVEYMDDLVTAVIDKAENITCKVSKALMLLIRLLANMGSKSISRMAKPKPLLLSMDPTASSALESSFREERNMRASLPYPTGRGRLSPLTVVITINMWEQINDQVEACCVKPE